MADRVADQPGPLVPAKAGTQGPQARSWIPAFAGMSGVWATRLRALTERVIGVALEVSTATLIVAEIVILFVGLVAGWLMAVPSQ